jgi:dTDP-4-dehydrorhamnose reductase
MKHESRIKGTVLVTGSSGFLGSAIIKILQDIYKIKGVARTKTINDFFQCDLTNNREVSELAELISPTIIIHAAGLKDIHLCEKNPKLADSVNAHTVRNISTYFPKAKIIYISTDYVFSGDFGMHLEQDAPSPNTVYGESKFKGELVGREVAGKNFKIIRTASVFSENSSFLKFLEFNILNNMPVKSYTDCIFSPTYIYDLVACLRKIMENDYRNDIFHVVGNKISRYAFAKSYFEVRNHNIKNLIKSENNGENIYLFKDLSLSGKFTEKILDFNPTELRSAFYNIIDTYLK